MNSRYFASLMFFLTACVPALAQQPIDIGSRLELFVDDYMVESTSGTTAFDLKKPQPQDVALVTDEAWEGNISAYFTVFKGGVRGVKGSGVFTLVHHGFQRV